MLANNPSLPLYAAPEPPALHLRSYRGRAAPHDHAFAQLVLPVAGTLNLDLGHQSAALGLARGAFVAVGQPHATHTQQPNRALILDLPPAAAPATVLQALAQRPFLHLSAPAVRLIDFMALRAELGQAPAAVLQLWVPLLLDTLLLQAPRPASRLAALRAQVEADLAQDWSVQRMAQCAALSPSRLHALFQSELQNSPRAWLQSVRLARARELLSHTSWPIAHIASRCGFADQSALTHAMRRADGITPTAWRRQSGSAAPA